jgi:hypothetical protein
VGPRRGTAGHILTGIRGRGPNVQQPVRPGEPERIADTIAELFELVCAAPRLYLIEWQTEPDPDMFGRLLVELGQLWQKHRPDSLPGSRYQLAASVINLTGTRTSLPASREFALPGPDGTACILRMRERYLAEEPAAEALERIAAGEISCKAAAKRVSFSAGWSWPPGSPTRAGGGSWAAWRWSWSNSRNGMSPGKSR